MDNAYTINISTDDFNAGLLHQSLHNENLGAIVTFTGTVRDLIADDGLPENTQALIIEHYPAMCQKILANLCEQALKRWDIGEIIITHRVGTLERGEQIVFVGVSSKHRKEAFFACDFLMDFLKTKAPFWKKETQNNQTFWVDAKDSDQQQLEKWET